MSLENSQSTLTARKPAARESFKPSQIAEQFKTQVTFLKKFPGCSEDVNLFLKNEKDIIDNAVKYGASTSVPLLLHPSSLSLSPEHLIQHLDSEVNDCIGTKKMVVKSRRGKNAYLGPRVFVGIGVQIPCKKDGDTLVPQMGADIVQRTLDLTELINFCIFTGMYRGGIWIAAASSVTNSNSVPTVYSHQGRTIIGVMPADGFLVKGRIAVSRKRIDIL